MMLRNLVEEIVRRRLWPIPLVALVVALAAPLLFLKSAPPQAAPDATVTVAATDGGLPARAQRLLTTTDARETSNRRLSSSRRDPFQAPSSRSAAAKRVSAGKSASSSKKTKKKKKASSDEPVPVVIQNADGSNVSTSPAPTGAGDSGTSTARSTTLPTTGSTESSMPTVDVRFGDHENSPIHRRIPRLKTFQVGDDIAVIFVKYSPTRHKAVFAINPTTTVGGGDVQCRRKAGVCRYVDIPAGSYARLTFTTSDGSRLTRRLDIVRVHSNA
jgi:hypothetical protein